MFGRLHFIDNFVQIFTIILFRWWKIFQISRLYDEWCESFWTCNILTQISK